MATYETADPAVDLATDLTAKLRLRLADYAALLLGVLVLFGFTAARTVQWMDYGQFTLRIVEGELFNELGLALAHALHFWFGQAAVAILPTEPAHAVALVSALFGAITVANVFGCIVTLTGRRDAGLIAALGLALANTFWRMSSMPECYTVTTALLSAELWALAVFLRGASAGKAKPAWIIASLFFNGLGLANHNLALLTAPVLGVVLIRAVVLRQVYLDRALLACLAWLIGASPYLALIGIEMAETGDVVGAIRSALFGHAYADNVMNASLSFQRIAISSAFTVLSFANLTLPLAVVGLWCAARDRARRGLVVAWGAALLIHLLFVLRYDVIDQHTFLLPAYTLVALFAGLGFACLAERWSKRSARVITMAALMAVIAAPGVYLLAASLARSNEVLGGLARSKPYRDDYRYLFVPWGVGETSAKRMADHAVGLAGEDGVVMVGDSMARFAVGYTIDEQGLTGVTLFAVSDNKPIPWRDWRGRIIVWVPASTDDPDPPPMPYNYTLKADPPMYLIKPVNSEAP